MSPPTPPPLIPLLGRAILLAATLQLAGCRDASEPVTIAFAFPEWGWRNVATARDEMASMGLGDQIRIVYDSATTGDPADAEVRRASSFLDLPGLVAVVGHGGSRGSLAAAPLYNAAGIPHVEPTGTSVLLAGAGPWTFPMAPSNEQEGAFLGEYLRSRLGLRAVSVFYVNDEYGLGLLSGVRAALGAGPPSLVNEVPLTPDGELEQLVAVSFARARPDAVVLAARSDEAGRIMAAFHALDTAIVFVGGDGVELGPRLSSAAGESLANLVSVTFWDAHDPSARNRDFVRRFEEVVGEGPQSAHAMRHDALMVVVEAVRQGARTPAEVRSFLESLGVSRPPYPGVTGAVSFAPGRAPRLFLMRGTGERVDLAPEGAP